MAVPKRRVTKTRAAKRRTHYKLKNVATVQKCPSCGAFKQPHKICPSCGEYWWLKLLLMQWVGTSVLNLL